MIVLFDMMRYDTIVRFMKFFSEGHSATIINRNAKLSYACSYLVVKKLEKGGFITRKRNGRMINLFMTAKGRKLYDICCEVDALLKE